MYNFGIPGKLKAYFDLLGRVGETFKYGESGPEGLLKGKKAFIAIATGGTPTLSPYDHVTNYLKTFFSFIGIEDVNIVAIDQRGDQEELFTKAQEEIKLWT